MNPQLSVVIPVHNEAGNIGPLLAQLTAVLRQRPRTFEIIVVNDASTDATAAEVAARRAEIPECRELRLERHAGQAAALLEGLRAAAGALIVTLDGDGQNDPADIPALLFPLEAGVADLVCGWRVNRHDTVGRQIMSRLANAVRGFVLRDHVHDAGCQLRVFRREVCAAFEPMELMQSFVPALAVAAGFRVAEVPVRHHARTHGNSKYGFSRLWWRPAVAMLRLRWRMWRRRR